MDAFPASDGQVYALRGPVMADSLTQTVLLASNFDVAESAQLFAGFRGTGKSTELREVARRLRGRGGFTVLTVDVLQLFNNAKAPTAEELALILVAGLEEAASEDPLLASRVGTPVWERLVQWTKEHRLGVEVEGSVALGPLDLRAQLKEGAPTLRSRLRTLLGASPRHLQTFLHGRVAELAQAVLPNQLVVVVDNLEKFFASTEQVVQIYHDLATLFYSQVDLLRIPRCHVIYTVPPYLGLLNRALASHYEIRVLPSVKISGPPPDRAHWGPGREAMARILERRVDLPAIFGGDVTGCVGALVDASGGHVRDLLNLTRRVLSGASRAQLPISRAQVEQTILWAQSERAGPMWRDLGKLLRHVAQHASLTDLEEDQMGALTRAMDEDLVLCYHNGQPWYDVHPLVRGRLPAGSS